ncbi:hypothetical protein [Chryseobacterium potabilaquae]|uniref:Uncharacterized protein n=1 Tax=Chryseobacterium potabilaquae TaxID=2675057 RepID=A0A6N4X2L5_9FLAO|nr:hypothetical protein [Chryseobacterium potabilaquae]CAA7195133.1 hypothetical protein CHRY9293_01378 [Chryseobacterium potabilaquae]
MVESQEIKDQYISLLSRVENEVTLNPLISPYYDYLNTFREAFTDEANVLHKDHLKEFLIGANRYSDEFSFSDDYYHKVKETINNLYEILNR